MSEKFFNRVYEVVRQIPYGTVASYGQVARLAGNSRMARQVGWALHNIPDDSDLPCHRVVFADGSVCPGFIFGGEGEQRKFLCEEGVLFGENGKVDFSCFWELLDMPNN